MNLGDSASRFTNERTNTVTLPVYQKNKPIDQFHSRRRWTNRESPCAILFVKQSLIQHIYLAREMIVQLEIIDKSRHWPLHISRRRIDQHECIKIHPGFYCESNPPYSLARRGCKDFPVVQGLHADGESGRDTLLMYYNLKAYAEKMYGDKRELHYFESNSTISKPHPELTKVYEDLLQCCK